VEKLDFGAKSATFSATEQDKEIVVKLRTGPGFIPGLMTSNDREWLIEVT